MFITNVRSFFHFWMIAFHNERPFVITSPLHVFGTFHGDLLLSRMFGGVLHIVCLLCIHTPRGICSKLDFFVHCGLPP